MLKEIRQLKSKKFWLNVLEQICGWLVPALQRWIDKKIAIIKQRLSDINLTKIPDQTK